METNLYFVHSFATQRIIPEYFLDETMNNYMIRNFFALLLVCLIAFSSSIYAGRFGGGRSFGMSRSISGFVQPKSSYISSRSVSNSIRQNSSNRWLGPLAGLALGGILATLFMGHGFGSGIFAWIAIAMLVFYLINFLRNKMQFVSQSNTPNSFNSDFNQNNFTDPTFMKSKHDFPINQTSAPADFDDSSFLREVKQKFIRLQTAYDQRNLNDLREFTTPDVFAEIQLQLHERGDVINQTNVITLNAEVLDITTTENQIPLDNHSPNMIASVNFSGLIQEETNKPAISFNEIWHFRKDLAISEKWLVAGIQQN